MEVCWMGWEGIQPDLDYPCLNNHPSPSIRETTHTVDKDVVLSGYVIKDPAPVWMNPPAYAKLRQASAIAAKNAAAIKGGLTSPSHQRSGGVQAAGSAGATALHSARSGSLARSGSFLRLRVQAVGGDGADQSLPNATGAGSKSTLGQMPTPRRDAIQQLV